MIGKGENKTLLAFETRGYRRILKKSWVKREKNEDVIS